MRFAALLAFFALAPRLVMSIPPAATLCLSSEHVSFDCHEVGLAQTDEPQICASPDTDSACFDLPGSILDCRVNAAVRELSQEAGTVTLPAPPGFAPVAPVQYVALLPADQSQAQFCARDFCSSIALRC